MRSTGVICLGVLTVAVFSAAQDLVVEKNPQALSLLTQAEVACGADVAQVVSTRLTVKITSHSPEGNQSAADAVIVTSGGKVRTEVKTPEGTRAFIVTEAAAWNQTANGKVEFYPRKAMAALGAINIPCLVIRGESIAPKSRLEIRETSRVVITRNADRPNEFAEPYELLLDSRSSLISGLTYNRYSPQNLKVSLPVEVRYSDYRLIKGVPIPFRMEEYIRGHLATTVEVSAVAINQAVDENSFAVRREQ